MAATLSRSKSNDITRWHGIGFRVVPRGNPVTTMEIAMLAQGPGRYGEFMDGHTTATLGTHQGLSSNSDVRTDRQSKTAAVDVEAYYTRYAPMVLRRCRKLLGSEEAALDALQDTFVNVLRNRERLADDSPSGLLYRIATNVCLNKLRAAARNRETAGTDLLQRIAHTAAPEDRFIAANLISRLFARQRESTRAMAVMHLLDGMTVREVAEEVGMSVSGVRKRLRPLRDQLSTV